MSTAAQFLLESPKTQQGIFDIIRGMGTRSTVTVIMPTYNRRTYLPKALECIRAQTFVSWRLLVVNDGGEDVADLITACGDSRIEYFNRPHAGKAAQLNFALTHVTSAYVAYMDDDDEVFPSHLQDLMTAAEDEKADFVYSDTFLTQVDLAGRVMWRTVENEADVTPDMIRLVNRINHKQILHTKALSDRVGPYDEQMSVFIDYDYIKRLLNAAEHPFHVRKTTGDHILRMDPKTGEYQSISGIWKRNPAVAGQSLISFFVKDPESLASLYRAYVSRGDEITELKRQLGKTFIGRLRRLMGKPPCA